MIQLENDGGLVTLIRGNDDHAYLYIIGMEGPHAYPTLINEQQPRGDCKAVVDTRVQLGGATNGRQELIQNGHRERVSTKAFR